MSGGLGMAARMSDEAGSPGSAVAPERREGERSEPSRSGGATAGARRGFAVADEAEKSDMPGYGPGADLALEANVAPDFSPPSSEVKPRPRRRRFTAAYKSEILRRADACRVPGEIGALLRKEGLYTSHLSVWRQQREAGTLRALSPKRRGRKPAPANPLASRVAELERDNRRLQARLRKAETIIDVQKKVSELLGIPLSAPSLDEND